MLLPTSSNPEGKEQKGSRLASLKRTEKEKGRGSERSRGWGRELDKKGGVVVQIDVEYVRRGERDGKERFLKWDSEVG